MLNDLWVSFLNLFQRMFKGRGAVTTQDYTSVNIKFGRQFEAAGYRSDAIIEDIIIQTGDKPVLIKALLVEVDGDGIQYQFFENPIFGALGNPVEIFNIKSDSPNDTSIQMDLCTTVSDTGTPISALITILGNMEPGVSSTPSKDVRGFERPLATNSTYLLRRESLTAAQSQRSDFYATWYEGDFDYNLEAE